MPGSMGSHRPGLLARLLAFLGSHFANRRIVFTVAALAVLSSKAIHIHAHHRAVGAKVMSQWGYSFFAQDIGIIIFMRLLLDPWTAFLPRLSSIFFHFISGSFVMYNIFLCIIALTFYFDTRSEIHWRNLALAGDASSRGLILSATFYFALVVCGLLFSSWLLQRPVYGIFGYGSDLVTKPIGFIVRMVCKFVPTKAYYSEIPQEESLYAAKMELDDEDSKLSSLDDFNKSRPPPPYYLRLLESLCDGFRGRKCTSWLGILFDVIMYFTVAGFIIMPWVQTAHRPHEATLSFLSWTTAVLPFIDVSSSSPALKKLKPVFMHSMNKWDNMTALAEPIPLQWLKEDAQLPGFEDWISNFAHYDAGADPMKITNLEQPLLSSLNSSLSNAPIKHVVLIFLESTRNDAFPIKKNGTIWNRLSESWPNRTMPANAQNLISKLMPNANFITGDYDDGFHFANSSKPKRGGIRFTNAKTTATYTLKSLTGTLCGIPPLLADFNIEYTSHFYQPCLPQILNAMSHVENAGGTTGPYNGAQWQSYFFMTATNKFDNSDVLLRKIGYPDKNTIGTEYLRSGDARHGPVNAPETNYFGFEEDFLEDYMRDAFTSAKEKNERVFLTHLTSTTHHPFVMPKSEEVIELGNGLGDLSGYTNTLGYDDKWLGKIMGVLDDQGVANETLVVFVGDHGLSMAENDVVSTYYNPSQANNHVPLVLSHPRLPAFDVNDAVSSVQILPTILDLLLETNSLSSGSQEVVGSLVGNYEGQSLIRPQHSAHPSTGEANWQFTVVNPGRSTLCVRDAREPSWNFVVPVIENIEWQLSNIEDDPNEKDSIQEFDFGSFVHSVEKKYGTQRAMWVEEAASRTRWWFEENNKRWRYGLYTQPIRAGFQ